MNVLKTFACAAALSAAVLAQAPRTFSPPRLLRGDLPPIPSPMVVGGGEVLVEAIVDGSGALTRPIVLRSTPPFSNMILDVIAKWTFTPAHAPRPDGTDGPVDAGVLIAALFRPPAMANAPTAGDPPKVLAKASTRVPYPVELVTPPYPPQALAGSVVLFEVVLDEAGRIKDAKAFASDPGFDSAARDALMQWTFRPAMFEGRPAMATAYVFFGFSPPVVSSVR